MTGPNLFGSVSSATAAANLSALSCPQAHRNALPVEDLGGEVVAALCPDCDRQLPADWWTVAQEVEQRERSHRETHHGHRHCFLLACRLCAEELGNA